MRDISGGGGISTTVPVAGTATIGGAGSVVQWDRQRAIALFEALQQDQPVDNLVDQGGRQQP
jgi:hypothetical protein